MTRTTLATLERWTAAIVLVGGLALATLEGPEYLTRPRTPGVGDIVWVVVDAALFASLFVALWLRLQPAWPDSPARPDAP